MRYHGNELICLYEVWEALRTLFRGDRKARKALGIARGDRSRLTGLANKEPLNQGRQRGKFAGRIRNATANELDKAWAMARRMYEKYPSYLDKRDAS